MGLFIVLAILATPVIFVLGSVWASTHLLEPLIVVGWIVVAIDVFILLPLSVIKTFRSATGQLIFLSSYIFGLVTWLLGFVLTYAIWGLWAVIFGIGMFGGGIVPVALLATAIKGLWNPFFSLLVLLAITFGSRLLGAYIATVAARPEEPQKQRTYFDEVQEVGGQAIVHGYRSIAAQNGIAPSAKTTDKKIVEIYSQVGTAFQQAAKQRGEHIPALRLNFIVFKFLQVYEEMGEQMLQEHLRYEVDRYLASGLRPDYQKDLRLLT